MSDALISVLEADGTFSRRDKGIRPLYSITKTYIAACVYRLGIDPDRPASDWIASDWLPRGDDIRVRQILNHSSGLRDYGQLNDYIQAVQSGREPWSDEEFADRTLRQSLLFEPGAGWSYSNPGYWLLARIIERESGLSFEEALRQQILRPLQLEQTKLGKGVFAADLPAYSAGWVWHGLLQGSSADTATFMASAYIDPLLTHLTPVPILQPHWRLPHYGHGLMVEPDERFGHNGGGPGYSAACYRFVRSGRTICVLRRDGVRPEPEAAMTELLRLASR